MYLDGNWMILMQRQQSLEAIRKTNQAAEQYGLSLSAEEAELVLHARQDALMEQRRVEFGEGITPKIIYAFCDSDFIDQANYAKTLIRLQEIFYLYKNEMQDEITDDELLHFMKEQFEQICYGDLDYLEGTCLSVFAQAIRAGYRGYQASEGYGVYQELDEVKRWDYELYREALKDLCWR